MTGFRKGCDTRSIVDTWGSATMGRHLPESSDKRVAGNDIRAIYIDEFAYCGMTLEFAEAALERFRQRKKWYFGILSLEAQDSLLNLESPVQSAVNNSDVGGIDDAPGAVFGIDDKRDLGGAVGAEVIERWGHETWSSTASSFLSHQETKSLGKRTRSVRAGVGAGWRSAYKSIWGGWGDVKDVWVTIPDELKKAREETDNARVELAKLTKAQYEMKEVYTMEVDWLHKEHVEEVFS